MFPNKLPWVAFVLSHVAFWGSLCISADKLPAKMATHFDAAGVANDWMSRTSYLQFMGGMTLGLSLFMLGIIYTIRYLPTSLINLPNREYWLSGDRRPYSLRDLFQAGVWLCALETLFMTGMHWLTVKANSAVPERLSNVGFWGLMVVMFLGLGVWIYRLYCRFHKPPTEPGGTLSRVAR